MRQVFRSWRRRTGLVTLVLACMLTSIWLRSGQWIDECVFPCAKYEIGIISVLGGLDLYCITVAEERQSFHWAEIQLTSRPVIPGPAGEPEHPLSFMILHAEKKWAWAGFFVGTFEFVNGRRDDDLIIPYWAIITPVTVLSCWLLLSSQTSPSNRSTDNHSVGTT